MFHEMVRKVELYPKKIEALISFQISCKDLDTCLVDLGMMHMLLMCHLQMNVLVIYKTMF